MSLNMNFIEKSVIDGFPLPEEQKDELRGWYQGLINKMEDERLQEKGHLSELNEIMVELTYLHQSLLTLYQDNIYQKLVSEAQPSLDELKQKTQGKSKTEVETAMNGLFGVLILKLRKEEVSDATQEAVKSISKMMAHLAGQYHKMKTGELALPKVQEN